MDEDLEDMGVGEELGQHDALGGLVRADLVDGGAPGHPESHYDGAALLLDELLAGHPQVFDTRHRPASYLEAVTVELALLQLVDSLGAHVVPGEHRVGHPDTVHAMIVA